MLQRVGYILIARRHALKGRLGEYSERPGFNFWSSKLAPIPILNSLNYMGDGKLIT